MGKNSSNRLSCAWAIDSIRQYIITPEKNVFGNPVFQQIYKLQRFPRRGPFKLNFAAGDFRLFKGQNWKGSEISKTKAI